MPTISQFYGINIYIYPKDHNPPHFHVKYAEYNAIININTGALMAGELPPKARALTEEWRIIHQKELNEAFEYDKISSSKNHKRFRMTKIIKVEARDDRTIIIEYSDGIEGEFNYEDFFDYEGILEPLKDIIFFKQAKFDGAILEWNDEISFCPDIIRSIISNKKIMIDGIIVFDPALKKENWNKD